MLFVTVAADVAILRDRCENNSPSMENGTYCS